MSDIAATNAAIMCQHLRLEPQGPISLSILCNEGETWLAQSMHERDTAWRGACDVVAFLVAQRPESDEMFGAAPTDDRLEAMIAEAGTVRAETARLRAETAARVEEVACRIEARVPGAAWADTGMV